MLAASWLGSTSLEFPCGQLYRVEEERGGENGEGSRGYGRSETFFSFSCC